MNEKYKRGNHKIIILCIILLFVVGIAIALIMVCPKKSKSMIIKMDQVTFRSQFEYTINAKLIDDNQIEYVIEITPSISGNKEFKNIIVSFNVMGAGMIDNNGVAEKRNIRFVINDLKIKNDGTYKGVFTYKTEENGAFKSIDESMFVLIPFEATGTIKEFST